MARLEMPSQPRRVLQRVAGLVLVLAIIPVALALATMSTEASVQVGDVAPRTILAREADRVVDEAATAEARQQAREAVEPVRVNNADARAAIVSDVRVLFDQIEDARMPVTEVVPAQPTTDPDSGEVVTPSPTTTERDPTVTEMVNLLADDTNLLDEAGLRDLVELSASGRTRVEEQAVELAQGLARVDIGQGQEVQAVEAFLADELPLRDFPGTIAEDVITPLLNNVVRPTTTIDTTATEQLRDEAEAAVPQVATVFEAGEPVIQIGQVVTAAQLQVLQDQQLLGLDNEGPLETALRVLGVLAIAVLAVGAFLRGMQPRVWGSGRKVLLLAILATLQGLAVALAAFLTTSDTSTWWYVIPSAAIGMLAGILIGPWVGLVTVLPSTALVLVTFPGDPGLAVFTAVTVVLGTPFVMRLQSRGDLRSATLRVALLLPLVAVVSEVVFGSMDDVFAAAVAAAINGLLTVLLVQGLLPFLENLFRLPTVTALLDLADRNHPLLRELEQKAMGSYNHSVAVASLVERACREIGADALLGSVAALYHDIGKVRRPHFFIENQRGIANPHDELEPQVSALIIQDHVKDGVSMAREYKLPPEVVACIGSHHGTMLVSYFYRQALAAAQEGDEVDENVFRYDGQKPRSREAAVLLLADCCEATTRSMTMSSGTMTQDEIESVVDRLLQERLDDNQFAESELTFADLYRVRDSIVDALVGIYHPRIAYPGQATPQSQTV